MRRRDFLRGFTCKAKERGKKLTQIVVLFLSRNLQKKYTKTLLFFVFNTILLQKHIPDPWLYCIEIKEVL